jgi:hypothetical protein
MIIGILIFAILIEVVFKPRLDITIDKKLLLWYGRRKRNYIVLN